MKSKSAPACRYANCLTPCGLTKKSRLAPDCIEVSLDIEHSARRHDGPPLGGLRYAGFECVANDGDGEQAETAAHPALEQGITVKGLRGRSQVDRLNIVLDAVQQRHIDAVIPAQAFHVDAVNDCYLASLSAHFIMARELIRVGAGQYADREGGKRVGGV